MPHGHPRLRRRRTRARVHGHATCDVAEGVPVRLDLLRGDIYRILDELARAEPARHGDLVLEFERAWGAFRAATARRSRCTPR